MCVTAGVLALGAANVHSIGAALTRAGADAIELQQPEELMRIDALVIPGVANLRFVIDELDRGRWRGAVRAFVDRGLPVLGICAGLHLLCEGGDEAPGRRGLGVLRGHVERLRAGKIPHIGWSRVTSPTSRFPSGWAYFAHSFALPAGSPDAIAFTESPAQFVCVAARNNVLGVQFHPERSGAYGAAILARFVEEAREVSNAG